MEMVGQLVCVREKGRGRGEPVELGPLTALRWTVYAPEGLAPWRLRRRLRKAERALVQAGAGRVILGQDFPWADRLALLRPVEPLPMLRACADVFALGALMAEGVSPHRGRVALSAPRLCPELEGAAERLCPQVRGLVIDAPGGEDYARYLQAKFGLPVAPAAAGANVTAAFGPGGGRWGRRVELYDGGTLGGLALAAEGIDLPADCAGQVLALLWERGEVRREELRVHSVDRMP
ncbi:MAG: hypothetical protein K2M15_01295 [Oscillospiraceae bacterium]|nr:hypothetical protein [Oscillospiraceae bacterium]